MTITQPSCVNSLPPPFLPSLPGEVRCEPPNNRLDRFTGTLTHAGQKYPLDNEKILLRGCTLRNTGWCFGLVLFGGEGGNEPCYNVREASDLTLVSLTDGFEWRKM